MAHSFRLIFLGCLAFGEMGAGKITPACQRLSVKALLNRAIALQLGRHPKPPWSLEMVWGDGQGPELCLLISFLWYGEGLDNVPLVVMETPSLTTHGHDRALCSAHGGGLICGQPKPTKLPFRPLARPDNTTWNDKPKSRVFRCAGGMVRVVGRSGHLPSGQEWALTQDNVTHLSGRCHFGMECILPAFLPPLWASWTQK